MAKIVRRAPSRWSHQEVLDLLCYLNNNIKHIRGLLKTDRNEGIKTACEEMSVALGEGFTATRIERKIFSLWKRRSPNDSDDVDDVYYMGAYTRTLPDLDGIYPGMLEDVARNVKLIQSQARSSREASRKSSEGSSVPRRSSRRTKRDEDEDENPIVCHCGFSHYASSCVQCEQCDSWQHVWCQYGTDDINMAPDDHLCIACEEKQQKEGQMTPQDDDGSVDRQEDGLPTLLSRLQIENTKIGQLCMGLEDEQISEYMRGTAFRTRTVAYAVSTSAIDSEVLTKRTFQETDSLTELFDVCFGSDQRQKARDVLAAQVSDPLLAVDLLKALIAAANICWVFSQEQRKTSIDSIHLEMYQTVICSNHGPDFVKMLHQGAIDLLNQKFNIRLQEELRGEARRLRQRFVSLTTLLLLSDHDSEPVYPVESPIKSLKSRERAYDILEGIFLLSLHLKAELPTTENYYEILFPRNEQSFDERYMQPQRYDSDERKVPENSKVELCITPGVIEYPTDIFEGSKSHFPLPLGSQSFIDATEEQRVKGRVVIHAIVRLQNVS